MQGVDPATVSKAPILSVRAECSRLPLPASPEYIALKQTRQRKLSESLTNLREEIEVTVFQNFKNFKFSLQSPH